MSTATGVEVVAVGEPLVAFIGTTANVALADVTEWGAHVTGAEANVAVGLARLGHRAAFVGRVGADAFGLMIRRRLAMEGVTTRWVVDGRGPTGLLFRNLRSGASPEVLYHRHGSAGSELTEADASEGLLTLGADGFLVLSGVTAAVAPAASTLIAEQAQRLGRRVCLDLNYRSRLWSRTDAAATLSALARKAHLVVGDTREAALVTGTSEVVASCRALIGMGAHSAVLRHGTASSTWVSVARPDPVTVDAPVVAPLDPVGAGDAYLAGLLSGLLEHGEGSPDRCLQRAHLCGSAVVGTIGDIEGSLHRYELAALEAAGADRGRDPLR